MKLSRRALSLKCCAEKTRPKVRFHSCLASRDVAPRSPVQRYSFIHTWSNERCPLSGMLRREPPPQRYSFTSPYGPKRSTLTGMLRRQRNSFKGAVFSSHLFHSAPETNTIHKYKKKQSKTKKPKTKILVGQNELSSSWLCRQAWQAGFFFSPHFSIPKLTIPPPHRTTPHSQYNTTVLLLVIADHRGVVGGHEPTKLSVAGRGGVVDGVVVVIMPVLGLVPAAAQRLPLVLLLSRRAVGGVVAALVLVLVLVLTPTLHTLQEHVLHGRVHQVLPRVGAVLFQV